MAYPKFFRPQTQLLFSFGLLFFAIFLSYLPQWEFRISGIFYKQGNWLGSQVYIFQLAYQYLIIPVAAIWCYIFSRLFWLKKTDPGLRLDLAVNRRRVRFLVTVLLIALLVELIKHFIDRSRPYSITEFGGVYEYLPIGFRSYSPDGIKFTSFPSGHATSGFSLIAGFYYLCPDSKKKAYLTYFAALILGIALSITRVAQGGHYLSDVIASLAFTQVVIAIFEFVKFGSPKLKEYKPGYILVIKRWVFFGLIGALWAIAILKFGLNYFSALRKTILLPPLATGQEVQFKIPDNKIKVKVIKHDAPAKVNFIATAKGTPNLELIPVLEILSSDDQVLEMPSSDGSNSASQTQKPPTSMAPTDSALNPPQKGVVSLAKPPLIFEVMIKKKGLTLSFYRSIEIYLPVDQKYHILRE